MRLALQQSPVQVAGSWAVGRCRLRIVRFERGGVTALLEGCGVVLTRELPEAACGDQVRQVPGAQLYLLAGAPLAVLRF